MAEYTAEQEKMIHDDHDALIRIGADFRHMADDVAEIRASIKALGKLESAVNSLTAARKQWSAMKLSFIVAMGSISGSILGAVILFIVHG